MPVWTRHLLSCLAWVLVFAGCQKAPAPKGQCSLNSDCPSGFICSSKSCVNAAELKCGARDVCRANLDCPSMVCEEGCCLNSCTDDIECDVTEFCIEKVCRVAESSKCLSDSDCSNESAPRCERDSGVCVRCLENAHCPEGLT